MPRGARFEPFGNPWASVGCFSGVKMESWMSFSHVLFRFDSRFVFSSIFYEFLGSNGARFLLHFLICCRSSYFCELSVLPRENLQLSCFQCIIVHDFLTFSTSEFQCFLGEGSWSIFYKVLRWFLRLWEVKNSKKATKCVTMAVMVGCWWRRRCWQGKWNVKGE